jgi:hypothetical protein
MGGERADTRRPLLALVGVVLADRRPLAPHAGRVQPGVEVGGLLDLVCHGLLQHDGRGLRDLAVLQHVPTGVERGRGTALLEREARAHLLLERLGQ